eukprot:gb/GECG01007034.1/.p1 GENE.gb/GECG01007034.1/~~gb/GECG01007034.1/.p1  ORF type:complete len:117 (+),score=8.85 gb/GECG01007034.1/:1-351(+)
MKSTGQPKTPPTDYRHYKMSKTADALKGSAKSSAPSNLPRVVLTSSHWRYRIGIQMMPELTSMVPLRKSTNYSERNRNTEAPLLGLRIHVFIMQIAQSLLYQFIKHDLGVVRYLLE